MKRFRPVNKDCDLTAQRSKRGRNSRNKGASFERDLAKLLEKYLGIEFVRTPQSGGFAKNKLTSEGFRGDIVPASSATDFLLHVEAKNTRTWSFPIWLRQAESDCPMGKIPVIIAHKFNTSKKYILIDLEQFLSLVPAERLVKEVGRVKK